jgi:hypothetical protein
MALHAEQGSWFSRRGLGEVVRSVLSACCDDYGLDGIGLCDSYGTVIAASDRFHPDALQTLSAYAPLLMASGESSQMVEIAQAMIKGSPALWGARLRLRPFAVDNTLLYLCSLSARDKEHREALDLATRAVRRFMGSPP